MTSRREVRVTDAFFEDLDRQLGPERGDAGEPGAAAGLDAVRMFIGTGAVISRFRAVQ